MRLVKSSLAAVDDFSDALMDDLTPDVWQHNPADEDATDLRDYTLGCVEGIKSNLRTLAFHHAAYKGLRFAHDSQMREFLKEFGTPYSHRREPRFESRAVEIDAHFDGIVISIGSALDCMAGAVIGVAGIATPLQRADLGTLIKQRLEPDNSRADKVPSLIAKAPNEELARIQSAAIDAFSGSLRAAGPEGWLDWVLSMRNMLVHRERRIHLVIFESRNRRLEPRHVSPRNPNLSNMQAMRVGESKFREFFIADDNLDIADGMVQSLNDSVIGTLAALGHAWRERKSLHGAGSVEVSAQWAPPRPAPSFSGYKPDSVMLDKDSELHMNPKSAERLRRSGLITRRSTFGTPID